MNRVAVLVHGEGDLQVLEVLDVVPELAVRVEYALVQFRQLIDELFVETAN